MMKKRSIMICLFLIVLLLVSNIWFYRQYATLKNAQLISCNIVEISPAGEISPDEVVLGLTTREEVSRSTISDLDLMFSLTPKEYEKYQERLVVGNRIVLVMAADAVTLETYPARLSGDLLDIK